VGVPGFAQHLHERAPHGWWALTPSSFSAPGLRLVSTPSRVKVTMPSRMSRTMDRVRWVADSSASMTRL
jgi:hypothetical protein